MTLEEFFEIYDYELYHYFDKAIQFKLDNIVYLLDAWDVEEQTAEFRKESDQQGKTFYRNFEDVTDAEITNPRQVIIEVYGI